MPDVMMIMIPIAVALLFIFVIAKGVGEQKRLFKRLSDETVILEEGNVRARGRFTRSGGPNGRAGVLERVNLRITNKRILEYNWALLNRGKARWNSPSCVIHYAEENRPDESKFKLFQVFNVNKEDISIVAKDLVVDIHSGEPIRYSIREADRLLQSFPLRT